MPKRHEEGEEGDETDSEETGEGHNGEDRRVFIPPVWVEPTLKAYCSRLFSSLLTTTSTARN